MHYNGYLTYERYEVSGGRRLKNIFFILKKCISNSGEKFINIKKHNSDSSFMLALVL